MTSDAYEVSGRTRIPYLFGGRADELRARVFRNLGPEACSPQLTFDYRINGQIGDRGRVSAVNHAISETCDVNVVAFSLPVPMTVVCQWSPPPCRSVAHFVGIRRDPDHVSIKVVKRSSRPSPVLVPSVSYNRRRKRGTRSMGERCQCLGGGVPVEDDLGSVRRSRTAGAARQAR